MNHEHVFKITPLYHTDGTPIVGGRRCECGLEVVGDGPFALNAVVVRASRDFAQAANKAMAELADKVSAESKRRFPR